MSALGYKKCKAGGFFISGPPDRIRTAIAFLIARHLREYLGEYLLHERRKRWVGAAVVFDIDDTLVGDYDTIADGFDSMVEVFVYAKRLGYDVYIVTSRPESARQDVLYLFNVTLPSKMPGSFRGFGKKGEPKVLDSSHLKMLPDEYYKPYDEAAAHTFKTSSYFDVCGQHGGRCALSAGDRKWDVERGEKDEKTFSHVREIDAHVSMAPTYELRCKLPGAF